jgi:hemoglobin
LVSSVTGGPLKYTGKSMKDAHKGMGITDKEFDATVADLKEALKINSVNEADAKELLAIVESTRKDIVEEKKDEKKEEIKKDK